MLPDAGTIDLDERNAATRAGEIYVELPSTVEPNLPTAVPVRDRAQRAGAVTFAAPSTARIRASTLLCRP
jgi:hypothetical protein